MVDVPVDARPAVEGLGALKRFVTHWVSCCRTVTSIRILRLATVFLVSGQALLTSTVAWGQSEADRATARNLAAEGYTALKTQDFTTAEDRFRRADALVHAPTLVVDHARALIGLGRYVEAQEQLELVLREGVPDNVPWVWKRALQDAEALLSEVKPKVAWLTIYVSGPSKPKVTIDNEMVPIAALGVRRATDPGPRRIRVDAKGFVSREVTVAIPEGGERAVTVELVAEHEASAPNVVSKRLSESSVRAERATPIASKNLAYAALGLGGVGVVVGAVTGGLFLGARSELDSNCTSGRCPKTYANYDDVHGKYVTYGTVSGVALTVGVLSSATGLWLLFSDSSKPVITRPHKDRWTAYVTTNSIGVTGAF
jgi:hypothetical protein